jgi:limonene-1,2-epoxide hydrolase
VLVEREVCDEPLRPRILVLERPQLAQLADARMGVFSLRQTAHVCRGDVRRSEMENPIELVRRFCVAWSDNVEAAELAAFFTDDAVDHNIPLAPVTGREAIASTIASFIRPGEPGIERIEFRVINIAANGPVVMTERVDVFHLPHKSFELPVMGTSRSVTARSRPGATIST